MQLQSGNFLAADQVREFEHGRIQVLQLAGRSVGLMVFEPGWHWKEHLGPGAGTDSCQVEHHGYVVHGRMAVRMDDGTEAEAGPGDVVYIPAGHDGWVLGTEPCLFLDWAGADHYAAGPG